MPRPDMQIAAAFIWKAALHTEDQGRVCLVLPHGTIFNHGSTAIDFQRSFFTQYSVEHVLNLVDYQFFLFAEARHPAVVIAYRKKTPDSRQPIEYWAPKTDGLVMQAEIITVPSEDRSQLTLNEILLDLESKDAPQIWKQRFWATARDRRLMDRLTLYPRLRDYVRQPREKKARGKKWLMAEGIQPVGKNDDPTKAKKITLPSKRFIKARSSKLDLFLLRDDCANLPAAEFIVRSRSNTATAVFKAPHVLVAKGFSSIAYADFHVSFRHALRGITGPRKDRDLFVFLAAYLRSPTCEIFLLSDLIQLGSQPPRSTC